MEERRVRIKNNDLQASRNSQGLADEMLKMRGKIYTVINKNSGAVCVRYNEHGGEYYWFDTIDVEFIERIKREIPPALFDPANIISS